MNAKVKLTAPGALPADNVVPDELVAVFADANAAVAIFDLAGRTLYANAEMNALAETFGYAVATLLDLAPDERTSAAYVDFERYRAGRIDRARARYQIPRKDGTPFWADLSIHRHVFVPDQAPLTIAQIVDITAEREAMRNEARLETALEAGRQGVWDHDAHRDTVTYSRMWRRLRGMGDNEDVDSRRETWLARLHPDDRERIEALVGRQQNGEDGFDILEYRERHRDGHYIWILSRGKPIEWDENGQAIRSIGTDTDITRLKTIEAELALEKERLQVTLQSIADGVISTDREGKVTFINKAAEKMTGWTVEAALGQRIETVFDSRLEDQPDVPAGLTGQCLRNGRVYHAPNYSLLQSKKGQSRYVREIASPIFSEHGAVSGAVMVFRDATKRRELIRVLEHTATHDTLTDLDNRASFEQGLENSLKKAGEGESQHALCLIDLDHFKAVNDAAGHSAGDALLKEIARIIRRSCRKGDCVARLGGDEFAVILNDCSLKTARTIGQKIVRQIAALQFKWQGEIFRVGASIGIASIDGSVKNPAELYRNADSSCYAAKRNGRGCVVVFG